MTTPSPSPSGLALGPADLRGLARLGFGAVEGVTDLVEQMHLTIGERALPLGAAVEGRTRGITGFVYRTIRGTTKLASHGVDAGLKLAERVAPTARSSPKREAFVAAINGLCGDHLEATANPLAIPMSFRVDGRSLALDASQLKTALPEAKGRIAVLVHGLCMNDLQWRREGHHHGQMLASDLGYTVVDLHYNSGLPVATNGARFAAQLDTLVAQWPVPVDELVIVGHSMGGLVARSACLEADEHGFAWRRKLTRLVCLGTPHRGALLEKGGHRIDQLLGLSPYVAPFARLGKTRSAGITDLRHGSLQPLPEDVAVYLMAATTAERPEGLKHAVVGDGLVTLASAWGEHRDPALALAVPRSRKALLTGANHWDLLSRPEAAEMLRRWLG